MSEAANVSDARSRATELLSGLRTARSQSGSESRGFWPNAPSMTAPALGEPARVPTPANARQAQALNTLQMRLQTLETVLLNSAEFADPTGTVETVGQAVASALAGFEQATGAGLVSALEERYSVDPSVWGQGVEAPLDGIAPTGGAVEALLGLIHRAQGVAQTLLTAAVPDGVERTSPGPGQMAMAPGPDRLSVPTPNSPAADPAMPGALAQTLPGAGAATPGAAMQQQIAVPGVTPMAGAPEAGFHGLTRGRDHALAPSAGAQGTQSPGDTRTGPRVSAAEIGVRAVIAAPKVPGQRAVDARPVQPDLEFARVAEPSAAAPAKAEILSQALTLTAAIASLGQPTVREASARRSVEAPRFAALLPVAEAANGASGGARTAEAVPGTPTQSRFAEAIAAQIRNARVGDGLTRVELSPRGLGGIDIEVSSDRDGALTVVIRAENSTVLSALREMREPLADMLAMGNGGALSFEDKPAGQGGDHTGGLTDSQGETSAGETTVAAGPSGQAAPLIDGRQLDIMT
ncbi:hypothetical protein [Aestuariivita sp.]|uniref:hypothetical protein n=1 Tax=Aestuariivita sp. TaxID=1872407 RepID=UPI00217482D7|nr:hypothetical protein [Aestuariivita sp.]MCE8008956.1 hypothetical protein [Aestuariivita sp.]